MSDFANEILIQIIKHHNYDGIIELLTREDERLTEMDIKVIKTEIFKNIYVKGFFHLMTDEERGKTLLNYPILNLRNKFNVELSEFNGDKIRFIENYQDNLYVDKNSREDSIRFLKQKGDDIKDFETLKIKYRKNFDNKFLNFPWTDEEREISFGHYFIRKIKFTNFRCSKNLEIEYKKILNLCENSGDEYIFRTISLIYNSYLFNIDKDISYIDKIIEDQLYFLKINNSPCSLHDILLCKLIKNDYDGCGALIEEYLDVFKIMKTQSFVLKNIKNVTSMMNAIIINSSCKKIKQIIFDLFGNEIISYLSKKNFKSQKLRCNLTIECCCCMEIMKLEDECVICSKCNNYIGHFNCISKFINDGKGCPLCREGKRET